MLYQNANSDLQQKLAAAGIGINSNDSIHQTTQRNKPPVEVSGQRLFERLGQLQMGIDLLVDRLSPALRPELKDSGEEGLRAGGECVLVTMLDQAADRIERMARVVDDARERLCI